MRSVAVVLSQLLLLLMAAKAADTRWPHCPEKCGNISVPYPFGIGDGCYLGGFQVRCKETQLGLRPIIGNIIVDEIYRVTGNVRVFVKMNWRCYRKGGHLWENSNNLIKLSGPYRLSDTRNKFTAIGCDTVATIRGSNGNRYYSGCISTCENLTSVTDGSCSGMGCCQTSIPKGLRCQKYHRNNCTVHIYTSSDHREVFQFNPCSWAFIADEEWFSFNASDVIGTAFFKNNNGFARPVLDWRIGSQTCKEAMTEKSSYACLSNHSDCIDSTNGPGYLCNCSAGYQGNPYLPDGCQDINECEEPEKHNCYGSCKNIEGNFTCSCPSGKHGPPSSPGGCQPKFPLFLKVVVGISSGIMVIVAIIVYLYIEHEKRKLARDKKNFFEQNGGAILEEKIKEERGVTFKKYDHEELQRATNKFDRNLELGQEGSGTVYEGDLDGVGKVAIKKAKMIDKDRKEEFINELLILSKINHEHVVKLLGCCLEVEVPLLIYEYDANGTLSKHIHHTNGRPSSIISFDTRLKIAVDCAEALAYLHSRSPRPILHGDVKSSNILLDQKYVAKVSDLGTSMLVPTNEAQFAELIQGTLGYLDPECLQTRMLTEKSDVYSFGVVLLELITGKPALYSEKSKEVSIASAFLSAMKNGRLPEILDNQIKSECHGEVLEKFAQLVKRCLNVSGEGRPSMKDVAEKLQQIILAKPKISKTFF